MKIKVLLVALVGIGSYFLWRLKLKPMFFPPRQADVLVYLTLDELKEYNGLDRPECYLSYNNTIYDTSSVDHYKKGKGGYSVYSGHEMAYALAKSDLKGEHLNKYFGDDISEEDRKSFDDWEQFYKGKYPVVGRVVTAEEKHKFESEERKKGKPDL